MVKKKFGIAAEVTKILIEHPLIDSSLLYERLSARFPLQSIKKPSVWNAIKRWKDRHGDLIELAKKNIMVVADIETIDDDGVSPVFKEMIKYSQWAERQGYPVTSNMILQFFKETHQLSANEQDIVRQEKLVEAVCGLLYDFSESLDWDPKINDKEYLEDDEKK